MINYNEENNSLLKTTEKDILESGLFINMYKSIINANKKWHVLGLVLIKIIFAVYGSLNSYIDYSITKTILDNDKEVLIKLLIVKMILRLLIELTEMLNNYIKEIVDIDITKYSKDYFLTELTLKSDVDWDNCNNVSEIINAINRGTNSLVNVLNFFISSLSPIFQTIFSLIIAYNYIKPYFMFITSMLIIIFTIGTQILLYQYNKRSEIKLETNPLYSFNYHLANIFFSSKLNGKGVYTKNIILENSTKEMELNKLVNRKVNNCYKYLNIFQNIFVCIITCYFARNEDVSVIFALNLNLHDILVKIWDLFFMINNLSNVTTEWCILEKYINSYAKDTDFIKNNLKEYNINEFDDKSIDNSLEYKIVGKSGEGKSTWMISEVIRLYRKYNINWLYLDQRMVIPKSKYLSIYKFLISYLNNNYERKFLESEILKLAENLNINKIVNKDTLDKPFESPSGGEEKRIIILQKFLPIIINDQKVKVIFLDEITSGLDSENQIIIRNLIEKIKTEFKIKIINIDHHEYDSNDFIEIGVQKISDKKVINFNNNDENTKNNTFSNNIFTFDLFLLMEIFINFMKTRYKKKIKNPKISYPPEIELNKIKVI